MNAAASERPVVSTEADLLRFTTEALTAVGLRDPDASDMARQIVGSEMSGHESHGMRRLPHYVDRARAGFAKPGATCVIEVDAGSLVRVNGNEAYGHLVLRDATRLAIERARLGGIAAVAVHNAEYAGRLADFCEQAASQGVALLIFVNDSGAGQIVAPPGAVEARLSTNPIAAGIPRSHPPHLILDMATSVVAGGRVSEWEDRGEPLDPAWVGPSGLLQFVGGTKGFGLALIAEALGGALTGAGTVSAQPAPDHQGALLIALDVAAFRPLDEFAAEVDAFLGYVKSTPLVADAPAIRAPGESSAANVVRRRREGVPIQAFTWARLLEVAETVGIAPPRART
ncbi:MAG: hypothetical protein DI534_04135 [Leifsonia xyli]|nr:MAG: hypothetical protein DI534_04135 [Leifsonia xyli]